MRKRLSAPSWRFLFVVALLALLVGGCQRRALEWENGGDVALIPIKIDWSKSGISLTGNDAMFQASVWFFPHDDREPFVTILEGSTLSEMIIRLPVGVYSALIFNEMVGSKRLPTIDFRGTDKWSTFEAYASTSSSYRGRSGSKAASLDKRAAPVALAAWSLERFEVTEDMVTVTRSRSKSRTKSASKSVLNDETRSSKADAELNKLLAISPHPVTYKAEISAKIVNLDKALSAVVTVSGAVEGIYLVSGNKNMGRVAHPMGVLKENWFFEAGSTTGVVSGELLLFGLDNEQVNIILDFVLINGEALDQSPEFDVLDQVKASADNKIVINVGVSDRPSTTPEDPTVPPLDKPIILPDVSGKDVSVDGWGNINIIIK